MRFSATRRKVLQALGSVPLAGPLAARAAAEAATAELSGVGVLGTATTMSMSNSALGTLEGQPSAEPWWSVAGRFFSENNILPDFAERRLREEAAQVTTLDPDIACKRSWSFSVKVQHQRQRNYERLLDERLRRHTYYAEEQHFYDRWGFWI